MDAAVQTFLQQSFGFDLAGCRCAAAIAVSFGADATATASPAVTMPVAGVAGHTGNVVTVSYSGAGAATATATSGGVGSAVPAATFGALGTAAPTTGGQPATVPQPSALGGQVDALVAALISANGQQPLIASPATQAEWPAATVALSSTGPLDGCAATTACAVSIAVSLGGHADALIGALAACAGPVGTAAALAIGTSGPADASARRGDVSSCAPVAAAHQVSAMAGNTGAAWGISLTAEGTATGAARSGQLGRSTNTDSASAADSTTTTAGQPLAVATSGSTGDSAGVAIGAQAATTSVATGNSGSASAVCSACVAATSGLASAVSGNTGSSYALAGAGEDADVNATSGDSGDVHATAYGTGVGPHQGATVLGKSGNTGNAFAVAVDLSTWVSVQTHSGEAGSVTSVAKGRTKDEGSGSTVQPSKPSHQTVGTGPSSGKRPHKTLLESGDFHSARPLQGYPAPSGVATVGVPPASGHRTVAVATPSVRASEDQVIGPVLGPIAQPISGSIALADPAAPKPHPASNSLSTVALVAMPFVVLGLVLLTALATSHRRRRRWRS